MHRNFRFVVLRFADQRDRLKRAISFFGLGLVMAGSSCWGALSYSLPDIPGNWHQTWDDEFNSNSTATDLAGWSYDLGGGGWGNNELETYTNSSANVNVSTSGGVGALNINAIKTGYNSYTSARIRTNNVFSQTYGVIEFRAKLPATSGLWPAVWMMPENSVYGGWPASGEIDILESRGSQPGLVQGSLHSGPSWNQQNTQTETFAQSGLEPAGFSTADWHTYDLEWDAGSFGKAGSIKWYVDGVLYETQTGGWTVPSGASRQAPFDQPFYLIMNMAVGGNYTNGDPINLNYGTSYNMQVDYVRAYAAGLLGDTDNNGIINSADLNTVMANFGKNVTGGFSSGDFNGDGVVNGDDLALFQLGSAEFNQSSGGNSGGGGGSGRLPEPQMLGALLLLAFIPRRRRA